ncbi:MAG: TetR/AcrR family transcriptional regulator [Anaerolineae bacterium]|nr:TetR/AcrR family transcriptional regulator [Anaerolineae bacterium]
MPISDRRKADRARRVEARTAQILDAAARVFAYKGFHRATTREIAAEAGVSEGTLYNYFQNKRALLLAMLERLVEIEELTQFIEASTAPPDVLLPQALRQRFDLIKRNRKVIQAVLPELLSQPELRQGFLGRMVQMTQAALRPYIKRQIEMGKIRSLSADTVVSVLQALLLGLVMMEVGGEAIVSRGSPDLPDAIADILLHGIAPGEDVC